MERAKKPTTPSYVTRGLNTWQSKSLWSSLLSSYKSENPPADEIIIPLDKIVPLDNRHSAFKAVVTTVVNIGKLKKGHTTTVRFKANKYQLINSTLIYS